MTTVSKRDGSGVHARTRAPSIQLHQLAERLTKALIAPPGVGGNNSLPLVRRDGAHLVVNSGPTVQRLLKDEEFLRAFTPGPDSGFVCDMELPPMGTTAKVGGRLLPGSEAKASKAIESLQEAVSEVLDRSLGLGDLNSLCCDSMRAGLQQMADSVDERLPRLPPTAQMVPVAFAKEPRLADQRARDIARVFSAIETVNGADCFDAFVRNIAGRLRKDGVDDEDDIDAILHSLRSQRQQMPGSLLNQFLDFLDDDALSRVRLQVSVRIMQAIAEHGGPAFRSYVSRVFEVYELFAGTGGEALLLDGSAAYGVLGKTDFAEHLRKALFYSCLPVWAEWSTQLFESRQNHGQGFQTVREVSYRFRVNGFRPEAGERRHAFDARLDRLHDALAQAGEEKSNPAVPRTLAQLVFLHLVVPSGAGVGDQVSVKVEAQRLAEALRANPGEATAGMLRDLRARSSQMESLAKELTTILQNRSKRILEAVSKSIDSFTVSVHHKIVNWEAVLSMSSPDTEVLVRPERGEPKTAWFSHLTISDAAAVPGSIVSYNVETRLAERSLAPAGDPVNVAVSRSLLERMLPIRLVPYRYRKAEGDWVPEALQPDAFDAGRGIEVRYDSRLLTMTRKNLDSDKERAEHWRAGSIAAFAMLTYVILWEVLRRIRAAALEQPLSATILRLQLAGREAKDESGSAAVYAVSQALEKALARELPIKLQGFVSAPEANATLRWRKQGTIHALTGGQTLNFTFDGSADKVAVVNYVTRPCDTHPLFPDASGYLFISRTYEASREGGRGVLKFDRMHSRYVEDRKSFGTPQLILEEIARLGKLGFEHVVLLSHHFGNRHLGRAAERHAPHGTREFLDGAIARYPAMNIYTLRRDVFPAMRMRQRQSDESGFEVVQFADHQEMYRDRQMIDARTHMPIYTFATLVTPDARGRPQSGFCTYFYDADDRSTEAGERMRRNILGYGSDAPIRSSLISVLRAIHFLESEKPSNKNVWLPVLDPYSWMTPTTSREAGELVIMNRRHRGDVLLSFPALLSHVTKVLHKEAE
jgi:hypothetical protein